MKPWLALAVLAAVSVPGAWSQQQPELKARELFYTPPPEPATSAPATGGASKSSTETPKASAKKAEKSLNQADAASGEHATPVKQVASSKTGDARQGDAKQAAAKQAGTAMPLGLRYSVLKRDEASRFAEVDPDTTFHTGDRIRLQIQANTTGYLYIVMQGTSGNWRLLFPAPEVAGGSNLIRRGDTRQIPPGDTGQFFFDEQAGVEKLFFVLSRQPEPDLDKLIYSMGGKPGAPDTGDLTSGRMLMARATVNDDVVARLRQQMSSRDLIFEKIEGGSGDAKAENAAYVVNKSGAADARLVVDVKLTHK